MSHSNSGTSKPCSCENHSSGLHNQVLVVCGHSNLVVSYGHVLLVAHHMSIIFAYQIVKFIILCNNLMVEELKCLIMAWVELILELTMACHQGNQLLKGINE